ncbi:MAG: hypothetical protein Q9227_004395 [Pyrenula ochraceoflavens]
MSNQPNVEKSQHKSQDMATVADEGTSATSHLAYEYEYLTPGVIDQWDETGRQEFTNLAITARDSSDMVKLGALFQELVRSVFETRLSPEEAGQTARSLLPVQSPDGDVSMTDSSPTLTTPTEPQSLFLDTITIVTDDEGSNPVIPPLLAHSGIPLQILREELEAPMLQKIGLIRDTFARVGIRKQTNLLYRQANFNLLREESEGFAKLMTELFTTSDGELPTSEVVEDTVQRVKAMIGAFDLDVGRTLDVVLDVFGAVLVKQYRFFVKFLRLSPWWPRDENSDRVRQFVSKIGGLPQWASPGFSGFNLSDEQRLAMQTMVEERDTEFWKRARDVGLQAFYEISRPPINAEEKEQIMSLIATSDRGEAMKDWIERTNTTPPKGNRDAAQLLGFKLRFYSASPARNNNDVLPDNLIYLSALLIKIGFISLKDLYPHVWRTDAEMEVLKADKEKEKEERERAARPGAGAKNALLMAGALADDTQPVPSRLREAPERAATPSKEAEKSAASEIKDTLPDPADQKVPLLKSLLAIGALPESLFILGKFPWILDLCPDLLEFLHRIIHHAISKVYDSTRPLGVRESVGLQRRTVDHDVPGIPKGQIKLRNAPARRTLRWAQLDREDAGSEGTDYRFYWDDWSDNVPICQSVDDVFTLLETFGALSGVKIGQDSILLFKLARIGTRSLTRDESQANKDRWLSLCRRLLIPALSLTKANPGVVNEVYGLLRKYPIDTRYAIYTEWFSGSNSPNLDVKFAFNLAKAETRDTLKRLSKTNIRPIARTLARIACANPHVVTTVAISQIEAYDNLAEVFVEGARYFTDLGYDVLTWCLIRSLGQAGRSRVQESGLITSKWLGALAYFASRAFKRYSVLDPTPVLQYVADQLKKGNSTDLILLEQVILSMGGIVTDTNYNESQILAMGGGELLQSQTVLQLLDKRHESKTTSRRLLRSLRNSGLAGQLLLSIAQERRTCIFNMEDTDAPLKLIGNVFDEIHRVLTQYLDLLRSNVSVEEFKDLIPDVVRLITEYGVQPEVAFWISRPTISRQMSEADRDLREAAEKKKSEEPLADINEDVDMTNGADADDRDEGETNGEAANEATPDPVEAQTLDPSLVPSRQSTPVPQPTDNFQWHPTLQTVMNALQHEVSKDVLELVGLPFYVSFWQLALYDILIPGKAYEDEISRQNKQVVLIGGNRTDVSVAATKKKEEEKKRLQELSDRLLAENRQHLKAYSECKSRLLKEKDHWFENARDSKETFNSALMEHCFLPRILLSPLDAVFCFRLLKFMQTSGTRGFRTLTFYDQFFKDSRLTSLMFSCTSKEADNFGRFLLEVLRDLNRWHEKRATYEKEAYGSNRSLPGFAMRWSSDGKPDTFLGFEDFRRILYKWHQHLCAALKSCFLSTDYMHVRNAISVLKAISSHYPVVNWMGDSMKQLVGSLGKSEQGDIKVPSLALMGDLNRRTKSWVMPQAFRKGPGTAEQANGISRPSSTKPLNAEAVEFRPSTTPTANGESGTPKASSNQAEEDGEVSHPEKSVDGAGVMPETEGVADEVEPNKSSEEATKPDRENEKMTDQKASVQSVEAVKAADAPPTSNSRSTTPHQPIPKRPESHHSQAPASSTTHHPSLPSRPERVPPRLPPTRSERFDERSRQEPSLPSRPPDLSADRRAPRPIERERPPRQNENDLYRDSEHTHRGYDRPPERNAYENSRSDHRDREHLSRSDERYTHPAPPRERPPSKSEYYGQDSYSRERSEADPYMLRNQDRARESAPQHPRPTPPQSIESGTMNPQRAALMSGNAERPEMSIKGQGDRPRPPLRTGPTRGDEQPSRPSRREDPQGDRRGPYTDSRDDHGPSSRATWDREPARNAPPRTREIDMNHGRLNNDDHDPPSGPRSRSSVPSRGRGVPTPQPRLDTDVQGLAQPTPNTSHRREPSGPGRPSRSSSISEANSTTSATPADTTGIHPDRLRQLQSPTSESASMRPPPPQNRSQPPTPSQTSPPFAPSGPRGGPPSGPSPTTRGPPSGPQFDGAGRGARGNRHPLAAVNSHLQQANQNVPPERGPGMSIRGRGGLRNASAPTQQISSSPPNGPGPRSEAFSSSMNDASGRSELFPGRAPTHESGPSLPPRYDESRGPPPRTGPRNDDRRFEAGEMSMHPARGHPPGRRGDLIDEASEPGSRRPSRHSSSTRAEDATDREMSRRHHHDREDGSRREHHERPPSGYYERENRGGDYSRDRERDRKPDSEHHREPRDHPPSTRSSMRRDDMNGPLPHPPSHAPPPYPPSERPTGADRRGGGGYPPPGSSHPEDHRDLRSSRSDRGPAGVGAAEGRELRRNDREHPRGPGGGDNPNSITPQKRRGPPLAEDGGGYGGAGRGGMGSGGGYRNPSESKRPRRGG